MLSTKVVKVVGLCSFLLMTPGYVQGSSSLVAGFIFTGGPVIDASNIAQNIKNNIEMLEKRISETTDWKAIQKLLKSKLKEKMKGDTARDMVDLRHEQELATSVRNHDISMGLVPIGIPGCGDVGQMVNDAERQIEDQSEAILQLIFRDITGCEMETESNSVMKDRAERDKRSQATLYQNQDTLVNSISEDQLQRNESMAEMLYSDIRQMKKAIKEIRDGSKGSATNLASHAQLMSEALDSGSPSATVEITQVVDDSDGTVRPNTLTQSIAYLDPVIFSQLTPELYDSSLDVVMYLTGTNESRKIKEVPYSSEMQLLNASEDMLKSFPYQSLVSQFDYRMPRGQSLSILEEMRSMGEYYRPGNFAKRVAGSDIALSSVRREDVLAKAFRAQMELERFKKMLDKERMLAITLVNKMQ